MQKTEKGYYDIEFDVEKVLLDGGLVDEVFYLKDLKQRKLFLATDIEQMSIGEIVKHIMQFNAEDKEIAAENRQPIILYVTSHGGMSMQDLSLSILFKAVKRLFTRLISVISTAWDF